MNIYAGNLSKDVTEEDLRKVFRTFGQVSFVNIVRDRFKISMGFGILDMPIQTEAEAAIAGLNATSMNGKSISVKEAQPKTLSVPETVPSDLPQTLEATP